MTTSRALRVGVVLGDQLVEERIFDGVSPVTLGQSLRAQLSVPVEGVPREHVLFTCEGGRFVLHPVGEAAAVLAQGACGKLVFGAATILYQEVPKPPVAPRPKLPASIRGTFADRIDQRLAMILGGSLIVHVAIAAWAWSNDVPEQTFGLPSVATTYHHDVIDVIVPDIATPTPEPGQPPGAAQPVAPTQTPRPIVSSPRVTKPGEPIDSSRLAVLLTGDDSDRGVAGMRPRQPGADLDQQIDEIRDRKLTIGDGTHTSRIDDRARLGTDPARPLTSDPTLTQTPQRDNERPVRIIPGDVNPDTKTTLTADVVLDRIRTLYMAGLQRCYRHGLELDSTLSGRVSINFTVDDRGKVIDASARGVSSGVDGCIEKQMGSWRFPIPKDADGDATDVTYSVSLALQPS